MTEPIGYERDPLVYPTSRAEIHIWRRSDRAEAGPCDLCGLLYLENLHVEAQRKYDKQKRDSHRRFKQVQRVYNEKVWVFSRRSVISYFVVVALAATIQIWH
jgi:hypothetical protein